MHMDAVQKYVISLSKEEAGELKKTIDAIPQGYVVNALEDLYNILSIWAD